MAASNTPKKSTTKRGTSAKKKSSARTQSKKNTAGKQSISSGFQTEIILLVLMAAAIILMVSCVGLGGNVGGSISKVLMGVMGLMAYIFPVVLFIMAAFLISNKGNVLAYKKTAAAAVLFLICCGLAQLFTEGYTESTTLAEYYRISSEYRTGWRSHWRRNLYFYNLRIWNHRCLCDHCTCDPGMFDPDHAAFFPGIFV